MFKSAAALMAVGAVGLAGCGGQSNQEGAQTELQQALSEAGVTTVRTVPKETVRAWPEKFCSLKLGMKREQVRQIMGEPTSSYSDSNNNQDQWEGYGVNLTAFYDIDDEVKQLDDSTDTANLPCEQNRK